MTVTFKTAVPRTVKGKDYVEAYLKGKKVLVRDRRASPKGYLVAAMYPPEEDVYKPKGYTWTELERNLQYCSRVQEEKVMPRSFEEIKDGDNVHYRMRLKDRAWVTVFFEDGVWKWEHRNNLKLVGKGYSKDVEKSKEQAVQHLKDEGVY